MSTSGTFVAKREYLGSEIVLFILIPRIISAFKMAGGQFIAII